jgi:hypothetical protein
MGDGRGEKEKVRKRESRWKHYKKGSKQRPEERIFPHPEGGCGRPQSGYRLRKLSPNLET